MYTEKRVGPRIEPCGTCIETARDPDNKNAVIDRVESCGQVDEDGCTVLYDIYDIVKDLERG